MTEVITISAQRREDVGKKVRSGRRKGLLPAVIYGHGIAAENLWMSLLDFERVFARAGESTLLDVTVEGVKETRKVLIHDTQYDPITGKIIHVDLFEVRMDEEVESEIPLVFSGEAPAVKSLGGVLVKSLDSIDVTCLPLDLPHDIVVDISTLASFEDVICVKDLVLGKGVRTDVDPEITVVFVAPPRTEEELQQLQDVVQKPSTEPERIGKKPESEPAEK